MTCPVALSIAIHCDEPEELGCPECGGAVYEDNDGDFICIDKDCDGVIILED